MSRQPILYEYHGELLPIGEIAARCGIHKSTLRQRLIDDWPMDRATTEPAAPRRKRKHDIETDRELDMQALVFAKLHPGGATHEEIGACLGITRARVQQIEAEALRKLKLAVRRKHGLATYEEAAE